MIARLFSRHAMVALVTVALIAFIRPAAPQAEAPQSSPAALLLAKQIIEIKGVQKMFDPLIPGVIEKVKDQFLQTNFMFAKDLNEIAANMKKDYAPRLNELVDASAHIYASHFTEAELKDILAFYQSPLGQKMVAEEPKALDESISNAGNWGDDLSEEVIGKMRAEMKKRGHDI
jgi:uncharacterized protein